MNLELVAQKLSALAKKIEARKGPLELLGLFLREDSPDLWDLVIAARWLQAEERTSFEYVAGQLREALSDEELVGLSRIVILEHGGVVLQSFLETLADRTGLVDVHFVSQGGAVIRRVYIIVIRHAERETHRDNPKTRRRSKANSPNPSRSPEDSPR